MMRGFIRRIVKSLFPGWGKAGLPSTNNEDWAREYFASLDQVADAKLGLVRIDPGMDGDKLYFLNPSTIYWQPLPEEMIREMWAKPSPEQIMEMEDILWGKNHRAWTLIDKHQPDWGKPEIQGLTGLLGDQEPRPLVYRRSPWTPDWTCPDAMRDALLSTEEDDKPPHSMVMDESDEACGQSPTGYHCYCWYEQDTTCCYCKTNDLNLLIVDDNGVAQATINPEDNNGRGYPCL